MKKPRAEQSVRPRGPAAKGHHPAPPHGQRLCLCHLFFRAGPDPAGMRRQPDVLSGERFRCRPRDQLWLPGSGPGHCQRPDLDLLGHYGCGRHGGNRRHHGRHRPGGGDRFAVFTRLVNFYNQQVSDSPPAPLPTSAGFPHGGVDAYADAWIPTGADRQKVVQIVADVAKGTWAEFGEIILSEPAIGEANIYTAGPWSFVRVHFT